MKPTSRGLWCLAGLALSSVAGYAQSVISARSGLIQYIEGRVLLNGKPVESSLTTFTDIKENAVLKAEEGRAEVLLTPGVFLRLGENSSFKMITNRLVDTRVEFLGGSAVIEADDVMKDNHVTVAFKDAAVQVEKKGLYRFDSNPPALKVFDGLAVVQSGGQTIEVKEGKELALDGTLAVTKFNKSETDALDRWSRRRGEYVAMANVSAAKTAYDRRGSWSGLGLGMYGTGSWMWNPYFGMFTYLPFSGSLYSPYGYQFWSPVAVYGAFYAPRPVYRPVGGGMYNSGLGYSQVGHTASGYSGVVAASAPSHGVSSAPSGTSNAAAPSGGAISRGGGSSGPRR